MVAMGILDPGREESADWRKLYSGPIGSRVVSSRELRRNLLTNMHDSRRRLHSVSRGQCRIWSIGIRLQRHESLGAGAGIAELFRQLLGVMPLQSGCPQLECLGGVGDYLQCPEHTGSRCRRTDDSEPCGVPRAGADVQYHHAGGQFDGDRDCRHVQPERQFWILADANAAETGPPYSPLLIREWLARFDLLHHRRKIACTAVGKQWRAC